MNRPAHKAALALICLLAAGATGEAPVSLSPAPGDEPAAPPYRSCRVEVVNRTDRLVRGLSLRDARGGLTVLAPATIAPGQTRVLAVGLLPLSVQQSYQVKLLARARVDAEVVGRFSVPVTWPEDAVEQAQGKLIDTDAYDQWEARTPSWSQAVRRNVFLLAVLACVALAGVLFLRRPALRAGVLTAVVALATAAAAVGLCRQDVLSEHRHGRLVVVTAKRTVDWTCDEPELLPVYAVPRQVYEDRTTVLTAGGRISATIRPGRPRLFRRGR